MQNLKNIQQAQTNFNKYTNLTCHVYKSTLLSFHERWHVVERDDMTDLFELIPFMTQCMHYYIIITYVDCVTYVQRSKLIEHVKKALHEFTLKQITQSVQILITPLKMFSFPNSITSGNFSNKIWSGNVSWPLPLPCCVKSNLLQVLYARTKFKSSLIFIRGNGRVHGSIHLHYHPIFRGKLLGASVYILFFTGNFVILNGHKICAKISNNSSSSMSHKHNCMFIGQKHTIIKRCPHQFLCGSWMLCSDKSQMFKLSANVI